MNEIKEHPLDQFQRPDNGSRDNHVIQDSRRTKLFVLLGSCILHLPIWGFAMSYGIFQEYYTTITTTANVNFKGDLSITGVIGTTSNGVMYLSMPLPFALFMRRWAHHRTRAAILGTGNTSALCCALVYSPTTLSLGEYANRAVAYGIVLSTKNIVGTSCPFLVRHLLNNYGFKTTMHPRESTRERERRSIPWSFLSHPTIYLYATAIIFQSSGYGIPQTYLSTYARDIAHLPQTSGTMLLALFNAPGIIASSFFAWLSDNSHLRLKSQTTASIPPVVCVVVTFLFWGLTSSQSQDDGTSTGSGSRSGSQESTALLLLYSLTFGFFSGGYSGTWGGMLSYLESEAAEHGDGIRLLSLGSLLVSKLGSGGAAGWGAAGSGRFGLWSSHGPLIVFTGIAILFGGGGGAL
ncbi:hypothetical protein BDV19DRAFT_400321 [Aspergillus venezuelensis]